MGTSVAYSIPIRRRHSSGATSRTDLQAILTNPKEWGYDETNEEIGVVLSDGTTYRAISRNSLLKPATEATKVVEVDADGRTLVNASGYAGTARTVLRSSESPYISLQADATGNPGESGGCKIRCGLIGSAPAANEITSAFVGIGINSAGDEFEYTKLDTRVKDSTENSEDAEIVARVVKSGSSFDAIVLGDDVYTGELGVSGWEDINLTGVAGFTGAVTGEVRTKAIGKLRFIKGYLGGTSNTTGFSFNLPTAAVSDTLLSHFSIRFTNAGTPSATPGMIILPTGASVVTLHTDWNGAGWTATGAKSAYFCFWYQEA